MIIIGLTGSIAMGKSATANIFNSYGVPIFNADSCVHKLLGANGKLVSIIGKTFPGTLEKQTNIKYINREKLGRIVFNNKKNRQALEQIVHPQVGIERKKWKEWAERERFKAICYDIPLLFETNGEKSCNIIVVVSAPFFIQQQRALNRPYMNKKKFYNILKTQLSDKEKRKKADFIVNTGIGYRYTRNQVKKLLLKVF
jgi:dephospho-CoA kinase